jgi:hypothetical protein
MDVPVQSSVFERTLGLASRFKQIMLMSKLDASLQVDDDDADNRPMTMPTRMMITTTVLHMRNDI